MEIYIYDRRFQCFLSVFGGDVTYLFTFGSQIVALRNGQKMIHSHLLNCTCDHTNSPITCMDCISKVTHTYVYTKSLTRSFSFLLVILTHN